MKKSSQSGFALVVVIIAMVILLSVTGGALLFSGLNLKTASNLKVGRGAIHAADAGIQHALAVIPTGTTYSYSTDANNPTTVISAASVTGGYTYTVTAINDPASSGGNSRAILTSVATGPNGSKRKVKAYVGRSTLYWTPPGAVYVPGGSNSDANFNTSGTFFISGDDTSYTDSDSNGRADSTSAGPKPSVYGVAPLYDSMVNEFVNSLSSSEKSRVQGKGYNGSTSPVTPSVFKTGNSFSVTDLVNSFKSQPGAVQHLSGMHLTSTDCPTPRPNPPPANCVFGTDAAPQITYIKAESGTIKFDTGSTVTGSGVLILDGKANVFGNFEFHGIVISLAPGPRGDESTEEKLKLKLKNSARIFGTLLLGPTGDELKFDIKDNASIYYSSQALDLVQALWGSLLPQPAKLLAWHEVME